MKKFTKIAIGLSIFFAVIGLVCITLAFAMGLNVDHLREMAKDGELFIGGSTLIKSEGVYTANNCTKLDIEFDAGKLTIFYDDVDEIEVRQNGMQTLSCSLDGNTLEIKNKDSLFFKSSKGSVMIKIPRELHLEEIDLEIGAGQAEIKELCVASLEIEVGAGQANLVDVDVKYLGATTGAGQIQAKLVGAETDYNYDVECGIGEIKVGNSSFASIGKESHVNQPGAERKLDIECGVGQITIEFQE